MAGEQKMGSASLGDAIEVKFRSWYISTSFSIFKAADD